MCGICSSRKTSTVQDCSPRCRRDETCRRRRTCCTRRPVGYMRYGASGISRRRESSNYRSNWLANCARTAPPRRAHRRRDCRDSSITNDSPRFVSASSTSTGRTCSRRRLARRRRATSSERAQDAATVSRRRSSGAGASISSAHADPAIAGQHGDLRTFRVCCRIVRGFDLSDDDAVRALSDWNARCVPPWSDHELMQKVANARRYGREPQGGLL